MVGNYFVSTSVFGEVQRAVGFLDEFSCGLLVFKLRNAATNGNVGSDSGVVVWIGKFSKRECDSFPDQKDPICVSVR